MFTRIGRSAAVVGKVAVVVAVVVMMGAAAPVAAAADSAESIYSRALGRERELKDDISGATLAQLRWVVRNYESVVRRFPKSGYCDNALWQGANVALLAFDRFEQAADRRTAVRLLTLLREGYPSSPLRGRAGEELASLNTVRAPSAASPSR